MRSGVSFLMISNSRELHLSRYAICSIANEFEISEKSIQVVYEKQENFVAINVEIEIPELFSVSSLGAYAYLKQIRAAQKIMNEYAFTDVAYIEFGGIGKTLFLSQKNHTLLKDLGLLIDEIQKDKNAEEKLTLALTESLAHSINQIIAKEVFSVGRSVR